MTESIYRILLRRNQATLTLFVPSRYRIEAKEYLWRHAEAIAARGSPAVNEWLERWAV